MSLSSRLLGWIFKLPPVETRDVTVHRDVPIPMRDGATLLADRYVPSTGDKRPTILVRSPYGRTGLWGLIFGRPLAEHGFQVLIQSCRGTFGSGGDFDPFHAEREDGLSTVAWLKQQPWFSGKFATFGPSYLGFVQWAIATEAGPELGAMAPQVTSSEFRSALYSGESFWLDTAIFWMFLVANQEKPFLSTMLLQARADTLLDHVHKELPISGGDVSATGKPAQFYQDWLAHNAPSDPWWQPIDFSARTGDVTAPVTFLGGWYDVFQPQTLADYLRLRKAGKKPQLTVGPWTHNHPGWYPVAVHDVVSWFRAHLLGDPSSLRQQPVRLFVMGADEWRDFADWPPPGYAPERFYLQAKGGLSRSLPAASEPDKYRYDPADPTPSVGGSSLTRNSGPKDNRALESRPDVLLYTTPPLTADVEAIGPVSVELYVKSSLAHTDFFARLCDVHPSGKSINVCDGIMRVVPGRFEPGDDGCRKVVFDLWSTAYRWKRGHAIRVQVSSGAHPRFARNLGTGEPLASGTSMAVAEQSVFHDPAHPSAVVLPLASKP